MILHGNQVADEGWLAAHLLKEENEHIEIHEVRGFIADTVPEAFKESKALSLGTRCMQHLFSLSLNPPPEENVPLEVFERAILDIENKLGLSEQPRVVVFHEKNGRRHCHAVWSRIDIDQMKAIPLSYTKNKLMEVSKRLFIENGWQMPEGFRNRENRNPLNFTREEWQQSKRNGYDPREVKAIFQECWNVSDSKKAFASALSEQGLTLVKGDKRGFVAVDYKGEVYSVARYVGVKSKEVKNKLGDFDDLPTVEQAKADISKKMSLRLEFFMAEAEGEAKQEQHVLEEKRKAMVQSHREARKQLQNLHLLRQQEETRQRAARFKKGVRGLWDRLIGNHAKIKAQNKLETIWCNKRDREEKQDLINWQLVQRRDLKDKFCHVRQDQTKIQKQIRQDLEYFLKISHPKLESTCKKKYLRTLPQSTRKRQR